MQPPEKCELRITESRPKASIQPAKSDHMRQIAAKNPFLIAKLSFAGTPNERSSRFQAPLGMVIANYAPAYTWEPPIADVMARARACVQLHFKNFWTKPGKWDHLKNRTTYSQSLRWSYFPGLTVLKLNCHVRGSRHVTLRKGMFLNPLSAIWRIYPSSKWSSQWPYNGYIRHGWMRSCGRGRDSATPGCFGQGSQGTIFVRSSKLSLFFPELSSFRWVFCFPRFCKIWRQTLEPWGFWFRRCLGALFENCAWSLGIFLRTPTTTTSLFKSFYSFFKAEPVLLAWQLWWSPGWAKLFRGGSSKARMETWFSGVREIEPRRTADRRRV